MAMIAIGKAASAMAEGAIEVLGRQITSGLVITREGYANPQPALAPCIQLIESAHPIPDGRSLAAGQKLLEFVQTLPTGMPVLFLISGGSSALVEVLPEALSLEDLQSINGRLLAGGFTIEEMNRVRKSISLIKGGGLLTYLGERAVLNLLISDVPSNDPATIGSGLLSKTSGNVTLPGNLPHEINHLLAKLTPRETRVNDQLTVESVIVADNGQACQALAECAMQQGYHTEVHAEFLADDVNQVAVQVLQQLQQAQPGIHIWGGEPTVRLPDKTGRGGRNQHLALLLADRIKDMDNVHILAVATDGSDGPGEDAGGLVDGQSIMRGEAEGLDALTCLSEANAGAFLEASGDLISTGPTGSNVMDLIIACKT